MTYLHTRSYWPALNLKGFWPKLQTPTASFTTEIRHRHARDGPSSNEKRRPGRRDGARISLDGLKVTIQQTQFSPSSSPRQEDRRHMTSINTRDGQALENPKTFKERDAWMR